MYLIKYLPTYLPMWLYLIWDLVKTLQRNDLYRTIHSAIYEFYRTAAIWPLQPVSKSSCQKESFHFKKLTYHLSMASWACVEYQFSDLSLCYLQQTVHFSSQICTPSFAINLPSLINLCTNMIQINISPKHFLSATRDHFRPDLWLT